MNILITGVNGFVGSHLAELIINSNYGTLYGTIRTKNEKMDNIRHILDKINIIECDITDDHAVRATVKEAEPDYVFHLAAQAFVPTSWKSPAETLSTNVLGSLNIFEAVRNEVPEARVQIAGSSEEYGLVKENEVPITEKNELRPLSPYGVSKVTMDLLAYQYNQSYGLNIIRTRGFNHTGPRRGEVYVTSDWSKQVAEIELGLKEPVLSVGNLTSKRDFTDVRDIVRAYWLAITKCIPGEVYNIASGKTWAMQEVLDLLLSFTDKKIEVRQDPSRMRPSDVPILLGDATKFRKQTGWKPEIKFEKTLEDLLNYWRERLKG